MRVLHIVVYGCIYDEIYEFMHGVDTHSEEPQRRLNRVSISLRIIASLYIEHMSPDVPIVSHRSWTKAFAAL